MSEFILIIVDEEKAVIVVSTEHLVKEWDLNKKFFLKLSSQMNCSQWAV